MKQITRNRTIHSCSSCRRRKIKCDRVEPRCSNCSKLGERCSYDTTPRSPREPSNLGTLITGQDSDSPGKRRRLSSLRDDASDEPPLSARSTRSEIESRIDRLTTIVESLARKLPPGSTDIPSPQLVPERSSGTYSSDLKGSKGSIPYRKWSSTPSEVLQSDIAAKEPEKGTVGFVLQEDAGRSRYIGNTHWAFIGDQLAELKTMFRDQPYYDLPSTDVEDAPALEGQGGLLDTWGAERAMQLTGERNIQVGHFALITEELLEGLPNKRQCDLLYRSYIIGCNVIFMLSQVPYLQAHFDEFFRWRDSQTQDPYKTPTFIPLLWAIFHGGSLTLSMKTVEAYFPGETRDSLSKRMNRKVIQSLSAMSFLRRPNLHGLIAYIIVETMCAREEEPMVSQLSFSLAVQIAQTLGLHREPLNMGFNAQEAELRRRVWWHMICLDTMCFAFTALPPVINWEYWDVHPITEVKDPLLGTPEATQYLQEVASGTRPPDRCDDPMVGGNGSFVSPVMLMSRGKHIFATYMKRVSQIITGVRVVGNEEFERCQQLLHELEEEFNSRIDRIPDTVDENGELRRIEATDSYFDEMMGFYGITAKSLMSGGEYKILRQTWLVYHAFAKRYLKMGISQAYCIMYKPFLRDPSSELWERVSKTVLPHAYDYVEGFIHIITNPLSQPFHWTWPACHQPLHAMMILLVDLYERPMSETATRSRVLIDRAFELTTPDGGISTEEDGVPVPRPLMQGGQAVWKIMRTLREKAWRKAGFDPEIIWSSGCARRRSPDSITPQLRVPHSTPVEQSTSTTAGMDEATGLGLETAPGEGEVFDWSNWDEMFGSFGTYAAQDLSDMGGGSH